VRIDTVEIALIIYIIKYQDISLIQEGIIAVLYWLIIYFYWSVELHNIYNKSCYSLLTTCNINVENERRTYETTSVFVQSTWIKYDKTWTVF
jgi:hypothetical protein